MKGAGFGRTGTLSIKSAFEILGVGPCHHMLEVMKNNQFSQWSSLADANEEETNTILKLCYFILNQRVNDS